MLPFLAQSVSIAFYAIGFGEAVAAMANLNRGLPVQLIAAGAVLASFVFAWPGQAPLCHLLRGSGGQPIVC